MIGYLGRRILLAVITLLAVVFFTLLLFFKLSPDPAVLICGQTCTPQTIANIRTQLGLDEPFFSQVGAFLSGLVAGRMYGSGAGAIHCSAPCLGYSFQNQSPVTQLITARLPVTITVALGAAVLWVLFGTAAGLVSALRQGTVWDKAAMTFALGGVSLPNYFVALLLQYVLVVKLKLLPFPGEAHFFDDPGLWLKTYLMPWIVLALMYSSMYARLTRANVLDTLSENFVRTARAKGLAPRLLLRRYALRPSLTPVVTIFGMDLATLLGGALITETVFGLSGVGKLAFDAIGKNDQPVIMAVTLLAATFVVVANIVVDLTYQFLDPRVRIRGA